MKEGKIRVHPPGPENRRSKVQRGGEKGGPDDSRHFPPWAQSVGRYGGQGSGEDTVQAGLGSKL